MKQGPTYIKENQSALVNTCGQFVYEVFTYVQFDNVYNMANNKIFYSDKEIKNFIPVLKVSPYIEVQCHLYSAPLNWLLDNGFVLYTKPEKKKRIKKENNEQKTMSN